jgi:hypothetical protein
MHLCRRYRHGHTEPTRDWHRRGTCVIHGCGKPERIDLLCWMHNARLVRTGTTDAHSTRRTRFMRHHNWVGDAATYTAVHKRLSRYRGPASLHPCTDCGRPAHHWSYDYADPNARTSPHGPYSLRLRHYQPRCRTCHKRHDNRARA